MSENDSMASVIDAILQTDVFDSVLPGIEVGGDQDLFEAGVDSLHVLRLVARTNAVFAIAIDADDFFQHRTRDALGRQVFQSLYGDTYPLPSKGTLGAEA